MRPSCLYCATKHLSQALILLSESVQGYPDHRWLAYGHMAEASDELIQEFPHLADLIREERKRLESALVDVGRTSSVMSLIKDLIQQMDAPNDVDDAPGAPLVIDDYKQSAVMENGPVFTVEDGNGKRVLNVTSTGTPQTPAPAPVPCGGCAKKAEEMKKQMEAELAAKELAEREAKLIEDNTEVIEPAEYAVVGHKGSRAISAGPALMEQFETKPQIIIMTTLGDFSPSYSLTTCIKDQALALANAGYKVRLIVQEHCRFTADDVPGVSIEPIFPSCVWKEDEIVPESVDNVLSFIHDLVGIKPSVFINPDLLGRESTIIISHDLLFQSWFVSAAKAIHLVAAESGDVWPVRWFHVAHSSVGTRPQMANDRVNAIYWRTNVPHGHQLVCLNEADRLWFDQWYAQPPGHTQMILNVRDPRTAWAMRPAMQSFVTRHDLLYKEVVCLFPLSLPRWKEKGLLYALNMFAEIKRIHGGSLCFVIAAAHANDPNQRRAFEELVQARAAQLGLTDAELAFTHQHFTTEAGPGLDQKDMDTLWRLSNLFIFPTVSEAGSLVLLEAREARCTLVLNSSVPALSSYLTASDKVSWVAWGSQKTPLAVPSPGEIESAAAKAVAALLSNPTLSRGRRWEDLAGDWRSLFRQG